MIAKPKKKSATVTNVPGIGPVIAVTVLETRTHRGVEMFLHERPRGDKYCVFTKDKIHFSVTSPTIAGAWKKAQGCIEEYNRQKEVEDAKRAARTKT